MRQLAKSHVKGHWRKTPRGNRVYVRPYETKVQKKPEEQPAPRARAVAEAERHARPQRRLPPAPAVRRPAMEVERPRVAALVQAPPKKGGRVSARKDYFFDYKADTRVMWSLLRQQHYKFPIAAAGTVRETMQNSLDAIRKRIDAGEIQQGRYAVSWRPDLARGAGFGTLTIEDNGGGIGIDEIQDLFLTAGGSGKRGDKGTLGGFGVAKVIILGTVATTEAEASKPGRTGQWTLESRDYRVTSDMMGRPLKGADIRSDQYVDGLRLTFTGFIEGMQNYQADLALMSVLELSDVPEDVTVTYNGKEVAPKLRLSKKNQSPYGPLEVKGNKLDFHWVPDDKLTFINLVVRFCKGKQRLYQFTQARGGCIPGRLVVDISTPYSPAEPDYPFNTARCALSAEVEAAVSDVVQHYIADPLSSTLPPPDFQNVRRIPADDPENRTGRTIVIRGAEGDPVSTFPWQRHQKVLKIWGDLVQALYRDAGYSVMPDVGLDLQVQHAAEHVTSPDGHVEVLMSPLHFPKDGPPIVQAMWLRDTLIHEMAHREHTMHDEMFVAAQGELCRKLSKPEILRKTFDVMAELGNLDFQSLPQRPAGVPEESLYQGRLSRVMANGVFADYVEHAALSFKEAMDDADDEIIAMAERHGVTKDELGRLTWLPSAESLALGDPSLQLGITARLFTEDWWRGWFKQQRKANLFSMQAETPEARRVIRRGLLIQLATVQHNVQQHLDRLHEMIETRVEPSRRDAALWIVPEARERYETALCRIADSLLYQPGAVFVTPHAEAEKRLPITRSLLEQQAEAVWDSLRERGRKAAEANDWDEQLDLYHARTCLSAGEPGWDEALERYTGYESLQLSPSDHAELVITALRREAAMERAYAFALSRHKTSTAFQNRQEARGKAIAYTALADALDEATTVPTSREVGGKKRRVRLVEGGGE